MSDGPIAHLDIALTELRRVADAVSPGELHDLMEELINADRIYVAGGGRSGLMARAIAMRLMHLGLLMNVVGETITPGMSNGDVLWVFSASGRGAGLTKQVEGAKALGARTVGFVANPESELARLLDVAVVIPSGYGGVNSAQHAGSLFEQSSLLIGDGVAATLQQRLAVSDDAMSRRHFNLY